MKQSSTFSRRFRSFFVGYCAVLTLLPVHRFEGLEKGENGKVDVVYIWANGSDPKFRTEWQKYAKIEDGVPKPFFEGNDLLKYSLRSLAKYAHWIGHVFIVTNGQVPDWLDLNYGRVTVVTHEEIYANRSHLPTFSSNSIETQLHRIKGLSQKFLYLNDDCFLFGPVLRDDFYRVDDGSYVVYLHDWLPKCAPKCSWLSVKNGVCDWSCYVHECQYDGGDCKDRKRVLPRNPESTRKSPEKRPKIPKKSPKKIEPVYVSSLQHTNRLLNKHFRFIPRRVPCHSPILLDRTIMEEVQRTFPREFDTTSSHRFKHAVDLQLAMIYYYYVIEATNKWNLRQILELLDTDASQTLDKIELRKLFTKIYGLDLVDFGKIIENCTKNSGYGYDTEEWIEIKVSELSKCDRLQAEMSPFLSNLCKYKFHLVIDSLRNCQHYCDRKPYGMGSKPNNFACLGDSLIRNMSFDNLTDNNVKKQMHIDLYETLFALEHPSQFERIIEVDRTVKLDVNTKKKRSKETSKSSESTVIFPIVFFICCGSFMAVAMVVKTLRRYLHSVKKIQLLRFFVKK